MTEPKNGKTSETPGTGLQKKYGPLPLWVYLVGGGVAILYVMAKRNSSKQQQDTSQTDTMGQGQIPQFVNQVYTDTTPPDSSAPPTNTEPTTPNPPPSNPGGGNIAPPPPPPHPPVKPKASGYSRGIGGGVRVTAPPTNTFKEKHAQSYVGLAHHYGLTAAQFGALNPALETKYYRSGKDVPKGTKITVIPKKKPIQAPKSKRK